MISTIASLVASNSINTLSPTVANASSTSYLYSLDQNQTWTNDSFPIPIFPAYIRHTSVVFCVIIMCLGVIGNIMVPIVIFRSKDMRNSTNIFLVNLSLADLMILLVCTPTVLVEVNSKPETWVLGEEMCKAVPFVEMTVAHASVLTILAISFERYYAICKPLKAGYVCTKTRASLICLLTWFFAALFTSPVLAVAEYQPLEPYVDGTLVPVCWTTVDQFWSAFFFISTVVIFFFLPLVILIILYTFIAKTLMTNPNIIAPPKLGAQAQSLLKYRKQVVLMLGTVVVAFFICLLPFRALTLWIIIVPSESVRKIGLEAYYNLLYFSRIMLYLNSAINPILYNIMSSKFRNGFLRLCGVKIKRKKRLSYSSSRKNNSQTTSTNTSSQNNDSTSFWNRYSHRNFSNRDSIENNSSIKNNNKNGKDIYVKIPQNINISKGESYV